MPSLVCRVSRLAATCLLAGAVIIGLTLPTLTADEAPKTEVQERKDRYTNWMKIYSEETKIQLLEDGSETFADLVTTPVFRYSDEERAIPDGTLWVWTKNSRPVAMQKVEGNNHGGGQLWTICFTSLSEELIETKWPNGRQFSVSEPGVTFLPIPNADAPSGNPRTRTLQIKNLKDRFTGRANVSEDGEGGSESRIIPKPIFEYSDPQTKLPLGAIFALSAVGTNPDLFLIIEAREADQKPVWQYACARMTSGAVRIRLDDVVVWSAKEESQIGAHGNWMYYFLARPFR